MYTRETGKTKTHDHEKEENAMSDCIAQQLRFGLKKVPIQLSHILLPKLIGRHFKTQTN